MTVGQHQRDESGARNQVAAKAQTEVVSGDASSSLEPSELVDAAEAGDWSLVVQLAKANWVSLVVDHSETLWWLLRTAPAEVLRSDTMLRAGLGFLTVVTSAAPGEPATLIPPDKSELERLGRSPEARDLLVAVLVRGIQLRNAGRFQEAAALADHAESMGGEAVRSQPTQVMDTLPACELQWAVSRQLAGDLAGAVPNLYRAYRGFRTHGPASLARVSAGHCALSFALSGDTPEAAQWLSKADPLPAPTGHFGEQSFAAEAVARVLVSLDRLDKANAVAHLQRLRALHPREGLWAFAAYAFAQHGLLYGNTPEAWRQLRGTRSRYDQTRRGDGVANALLAAAGVDLAVAAGQGNRARSSMAWCDQNHPLLAGPSARLLVATGHEREAVDLATEHLWRPESTPRVRLEAALALSWATSHLEGPSAAAEPTREAMAIAQRYGLYRPFLYVPRLLLEQVAPAVPGLQDLLDRPAFRDARDVFGAPVHFVELTRRERELLEALDSDLTLAQIAAESFVSLATVRTQRAHLYKKLGAHARSEALTRARELELLTNPG